MVAEVEAEDLDEEEKDYSGDFQLPYARWV
jgi:hypothetical protein